MEYSRITKSLHSPYIEADICTVSQEIHCLLQNRRFYYSVKHFPENKLSHNSDDPSTTHLVISLIYLHVVQMISFVQVIPKHLYINILPYPCFPHVCPVLLFLILYVIILVKVMPYGTPQFSVFFNPVLFLPFWL